MRAGKGDGGAETREGGGPTEEAKELRKEGGGGGRETREIGGRDCQTDELGRCGIMPLGLGLKVIWAACYMGRATGRPACHLLGPRQPARLVVPAGDPANVVLARAKTGWASCRPLSPSHLAMYS